MSKQKSEQIVEFQGIVTASMAMKNLFEIVKRVARTESAVLIRGQTGTGKELMARAIHNLSPRSKRVFNALNCATLSSDLMLSELFGHVKGAFTGAVAEHKGLFEASDQGSIFLDEIAEMPLEVQSRLLRVLQEKTFTKVGSTRSQRVDVRIISATNQALRALVKEGTFREDLMYRVRVVPLFLPPLTERGTDVDILTDRFIHEFNQQGFRSVEKVDPPALAALREYSWPGNIRELHNNIEYAFSIGEGPVLKLKELTPELQGIEPEQSKGQPESYADSERKKMIAALEAAHGSRGKAAVSMGMSRSTFWRKAREYSL